MDKTRILEVFRPHLFFDDPLTHICLHRIVPSVHVPFGVVNERAVAKGKAMIDSLDEPQVEIAAVEFFGNIDER